MGYKMISDINSMEVGTLLERIQMFKNSGLNMWNNVIVILENTIPYDIALIETDEYGHLLLHITRDTTDWRKPFNLEMAKAGHPVQTRSGYPVKITKFLETRIHAVVQYMDFANNVIHEDERCYEIDGKFIKGCGSSEDLMMVSERRTFNNGINKQIEQNDYEEN